MYRYNFRPNLERWPISILRVLGAVLIAFQLALPSFVFASSTQSSYSFGTSQVLDLAGVSVVRLVASYSSALPSAGCPTSKTGLGVLVGSWASTPGSTTINNWVLTDGSFVDPNGVACTSGTTSRSLTTIVIETNTAYAGSTTTSTSVPSAHPLVSIECQPQSCSGGHIVCQITPACSGGVVLIPFQTTVPQPFIPLAAGNQGNLLGIELIGPSSLPPTVVQATQFLAPAAAASLTAPNNELGMPIVNGSGQLVDMNTKSADTGGDIRTFVNSQIAPAPLQAANTNTLYDAWNQGIADFYGNNLTAAQTEFRNAAKPNPLFLAPNAFLKLPAFQTQGNSTSGGHGNGRLTPGEQSTSLFGMTIPNSQLMWLIIGGVVILVLLLLLLSLVFIRRQAQRRHELTRFEEERRAAEQKAAKNAAHTAEQEKVERQRAQAGLRERPVPPPLSLPPSPGPVPAVSIYDPPKRQVLPSQFKEEQPVLEKPLPLASQIQKKPK